MQNSANTTLTLFCPRKSCKSYQSTENAIAKDGVYTTKSDIEPRQMLYCNGGKHQFSETGYSDLFGKHGSFKEYEQTAKLSSYGLGTDAIADVLQKDRRTIEQWQKAIYCQKSKSLQESCRLSIASCFTTAFWVSIYTPAQHCGYNNIAPYRIR